MTPHAQTPAPGPDHDLIDGLANQLESLLQALLKPGEPVALLDFPQHPNVGDSAIWAGEVRLLDRLGHRVVFACSHWTYDEAAARARIGSATILIHGGGNFGDTWPDHQIFRERVLADFPENRVVQLPQTVRFADGGALDRARRAIGNHPDLTVLCRDEQSLAFVGEHFSCSAMLAPDAAFGLRRLRARPATRDVLWLARTDGEAAGHLDAPPNADVVDWIAPDPRFAQAPTYHRAAGAIAHSHRLRHLGRLGHRALAVRPAVYRRMAATEVQRGAEMLSTGSVVVTDRLHAHVLCLLLGRPHVVLDTGYGKLSWFHETWTSESTLARFVRSPDEVEAALEDLAPARGTTLPRPRSGP